MSKLAIKVEGIGKKYVVGKKKSGELRESFSYLWNRLRHPRLSKSLGKSSFTEAMKGNEFWALKDISFEVKQGEAIGIIGRNGAGKSTLLKVLSRITKPTTGRFEITGRVSSLLEVGTGFHPELTGRENIFLNGTILGMRRAEIKSKFDEIIAFSGVEQFLDTPVKHYSSGMKVRLAFSVAAHLEPEILIIDEVLAVGDAEFQKKCLGKMEDVTGQGRTVLFVSHNMEAVSTLTKKSILFEKGNCILKSKTDEVINHYLKGNSIHEKVYINEIGSSKPYIKQISLHTSHTNNVHRIFSPLDIKIELYTPKPIQGACFSIQLVDQKDRNYVHLWTFDIDRPMCRQKGTYQLNCRIPNLRLYKGNYTLKAYFTGPPGGDIFDVVENVCPLEIVMLNEKRQFEWQSNACAYLEDGNWTIKKLDY